MLNRNNQQRGLAFSFSEMLQEIRSMKDLAARFLTAHSLDVIEQWMQSLRNFQQNPLNGIYSWTIALHDPIETIPSYGAYEPDSKGQLHVIGRLSAKWEIEVENPTNRKKIAEFILTGIASTKVTILEYNEDNNHNELACWRFAVGSAGAPGCHFHTQIMGEYDTGMFPKTMSIPRIP